MATHARRAKDFGQRDNNALDYKEQALLLPVFQPRFLAFVGLRIERALDVTREGLRRFWGIRVTQRVALLTLFRDRLPRWAGRPAMVPTTPPTIAPIGPPTTAPSAAPAVPRVIRLSIAGTLVRFIFVTLFFIGCNTVRYGCRAHMGSRRSTYSCITIHCVKWLPIIPRVFRLQSRVQKKSFL